MHAARGPSSRHQVLRPFAQTSAVAATVVAALLAALLSLAQPARALAESYVALWVVMPSER
jgi:hypothetical protein